ncbi:hypothetical protein [Paenibacillus sp. FSL K6-0108]|uniref:hypothetical protein n=1 Tax=Paenibacillus sp. FSL K6-0108 TaxID=2921417 RepID=UPI0032491678
MKAKLEAYQNIGLSPSSIAKAIAFAIEQPNGVDVSEIVSAPQRKRPGTSSLMINKDQVPPHYEVS